MGKRKGRFNKNKAAAAAAEGDSEKKVSTKRQRTKEQVIHESVFESAVSLFRQNKPFCVTRDGEELFVGCYLPLSRIGGLDASDKSDETKGTMLNKINSGVISVLYTPALMSEEAIVVIPNKTTLDALGELWSIMEKCVFDFCFVDPTTAQIEKTDVHTGIEELVSIHERNRSVASLPAIAGLIEDAALPEEEHLDTVQSTDGDAPQEDDPDGEYIIDNDDDDDEPTPVAAPIEEPPEDVAEEPVPDGPAAYDGDDAPFDDPDYQGAFGDGEPEPESMPDEVPAGDVDVPYEVMTVTLERRFFNEDLTRTLDTSGLDQSLAALIPFSPLERRPAGSWLDDQVNALIDLANREIYTLHQQNLTTVRQDYLDKMAEAYEREMGSVTTGLDDDPRYAELQRRLDDQQEALPKMISEERKTLEADFERRVMEAGEAAKRTAENSFRERYRPVQEEKLRNVDLEMKAAMDTGFRRAVADLKKTRQDEASVRLDRIDSEMIERCAGDYGKLAEAEVRLWEKHRDAIKAFLEENREADIARVKTLDEEHARSTKLEQVEAEYKARVESLQAEFDARVAGLTADMGQMKARHQEDMEAKDAEYTRRVNEYRADAERHQNRVDELLKTVGEIDEASKRDVAVQVAEMEAERDAANARYDELVRHQRKGNRLMLALCGMSVVVALLIGGLVGMATSDVFGRYMPWGDGGAVGTEAPSEPTPSPDVLPDVLPTNGPTDVQVDPQAVPAEPGA